MSCAPSGPGRTVRDQQEVCHRARETAVAIGKRVDPYGAMMEAHRELVERVATMFKLGYSVCAQIFQHWSDLRGIDTDVLPGSPIRSRPAPGITEHPLVQTTCELARQQILVLSSKGPALAVDNIAQLPFIELPLRKDVLGDQPFGFVGVERGRAR